MLLWSAIQWNGRVMLVCMHVDIMRANAKKRIVINGLLSLLVGGTLLFLFLRLNQYERKDCLYITGERLESSFPSISFSYGCSCNTCAKIISLQRQAKHPIGDSPYGSSTKLSPIKKPCLLVDTCSREFVLAGTKRRIPLPEELNVCNGFKSSEFYTEHDLCPNPSECFDPRPQCPLGHPCKWSTHMHMDLVLVGECIVTLIKTTSGKHTKLCMKESNHQRIKYEKKAETTKMNHLVSIDEKQKHSEPSTLHVLRSSSRGICFALFHNKENPNIPFKVTVTTLL